MDMTIKQNYKKEIGERIRELRIKKGLSQEELAKSVGYTSNNSRSTINKIEQGQNDIAQSKLKAYAIALDTTVSYLLGIDPMQDYMKSANNNQVHRNKQTLTEEIMEEYGSETAQAVTLFLRLNHIGKKKAIETLEDMTSIEKYTTSEKVYSVKIAARNGDFKETTISESELERIKNLPDVDELL